MPRRVISLVRSGPAALRASDPVLEANVYALGVDVDLTVVLLGDGVELAVAAGESPAPGLAGEALPASAGGQDLRGLLESGVEVHASADDVEARGLKPADLLEGVRVSGRARLEEVVEAAEAVVNW